MSLYPSNPTGWERFRSMMLFWRALFARHYGLLYRDNKEFERAIQLYSAAVELNPAHIRAYLERGNLLWREMGRPHKAIDDFNRALEIRPGWPLAIFCRAMAHQTAGDHSSAISDLDTDLQRGDSEWNGEASPQIALLKIVYPESNL